MPIDRSFRSTWRPVGTHAGHSVWSSRDHVGEVIHGTRVGVHWTSCTGCMRCIPVCPVSVFKVDRTDDGLPVVDPEREEECILCYACEMVCPVEALHVERSGGSPETLEALLHSND